MTTDKPWTELIHFRLFQMPCCGHSLCWVNPRLPNHCPSIASGFGPECEGKVFQ